MRSNQAPSLKARRRRNVPAGTSHRRLLVETLEDRRVLTAMLQVVHNSPYASAAEVDVYVNDILLLDNFAFREATPFVEVPSETELKIDVKAPDSTAADPSVFTTNVTLADATNYIAMAVGEPGADFGLSVTDVGRLAAEDASEVDLLVFHGSPDAPTVDVVARDAGVLVDDISFGDFTSDYLSVPPATYTLDITPGDDNSTVVRSFEADLSGLEGGAAVVAASGFLTPPEEGAPAFGLLAVFPSGDTALLPVVLTGSDRNDAFLVRTTDDGFSIYQSRVGRVTVSASATSSVIIEGLGGRDYVNISLPEDGSDLPGLVVRGGGNQDRVVMVGSNGNDQITLSESDGTVDVLANGLEAQFDSVENWYLAGKDGDDWIDGSQVTSYRLLLVGDDGDDTLVGGAAGDRMYGGRGNDLLVGLAGNDTLYAGSGQDVLLGGSGRDVLVGGFGRDLLLAGTGNDRLYGLPFGDFLSGGPGRDAALFGRNVDQLFYSGDVFTPEESFAAILDRYGVDFDYARAAPWIFLDL